jgi:hypothetical protein
VQAQTLITLPWVPAAVQAVKNMFHLVYGMYPSSGLAAKFEESTFAAKAKKHNIPLPRISAIVHNK